MDGNFTQPSIEKSALLPKFNEGEFGTWIGTIVSTPELRILKLDPTLPMLKVAGGTTLALFDPAASTPLLSAGHQLTAPGGLGTQEGAGNSVSSAFELSAPLRLLLTETE